MEFKFETAYNQEAITIMAKALRKTVRKKRSKRSHIFGLIVVVFAYKVCCYLRTIEGREYVYVLLVPFFSCLITVWFLPCDSLSFITGLYNIALCKLLYLGIKNEYPMLIKGYKIKYTPQIFCDLRPPLQ